MRSASASTCPIWTAVGPRAGLPGTVARQPGGCSLAPAPQRPRDELIGRRGNRDAGLLGDATQGRQFGVGQHHGHSIAPGVRRGATARSLGATRTRSPSSPGALGLLSNSRSLVHVMYPYGQLLAMERSMEPIERPGCIQLAGWTPIAGHRFTRDGGCTETNDGRSGMIREHSESGQRNLDVDIPPRDSRSFLGVSDSSCNPRWRRFRPMALRLACDSCANRTLRNFSDRSAVGIRLENGPDSLTHPSATQRGPV